MFNPTKLLSGISCWLISTSALQAAECPSNIEASCEITKTPETQCPRGPLYTIKPSKENEELVSVSENLQAYYRGPVFTVDGATKASLRIKKDAKLESDYDVITLPEGASVSEMKIDGSLIAKHGYALHIGPKSHYGKVTVSESGKLHAISNTNVQALISIDSFASGELIIDGAQTSHNRPALVYTTSPKYLWKDKPQPGQHKLSINAGLSCEATDSGALVFGDPANVNIAKELPVYEFSTIEVNGELSGGNAAIFQAHGAVTIKEKMTINAPVHGTNHALKLGRKGEYAGQKVDQATFAVPEMVIDQPVMAYGTVISAEGSVDIGQFTINSDVKVLELSDPKKPPEGYHVRNPAAFDYSKSDKPLMIVQNKGSVMGNIFGSRSEDRVTYCSGVLKGSLEGIRHLEITGNQIKLDPKKTKLNVDLEGPERLDLKVGKSQLKLDSETTGMELELSEPTRLHFAKPALIKKLVLADTLELDLDTYKDGTPYLDATESIEFKDSSVLELDVTEPELGKTYKVLQSASPVKGNPSSITTSSRFLTFSEKESASKKNIDFIFSLKGEKELMADVKKLGLSNNQARATVANLEYGTAATKRVLFSGTDSQIRQLAGELTPTLQYSTTMAHDSGRKVGATIDNRIAMVVSARETGINAGDSTDSQGVWGQAYGYKSKQDGKGDASGYKGNHYGLTIGYDHAIEDDHLAGIALSLGKSKVDYSKSGKNDSDLYTLSLYGAFNGPMVGIEPQIYYSRIKNDAQRRVLGVGHKSSYDSDMFGLRLLLHGQGAWQPVTGVSYSRVKNDGHTFSGTYLNDHIRGNAHTAIELGAGVRYYQPAAEGWSPRMQLMAWYDLKNEGIDTRYSVGNGPVFTVTGEKPEAFSVTGNLGVDYISGPATYSCGVDGSYRSDFYAVGVSCQVRYEF